MTGGELLLVGVITNIVIRLTTPDPLPPKDCNVLINETTWQQMECKDAPKAEGFEQ